MGTPTTARPLYFRSFEAALRPPPSAAELAAAGWGPVAEYALQLLETPWPWDTSCTSMGVCPPGAACSQTTGFAIICAQGIVRDSVEPALRGAAAWWPEMLGGGSDSEAHLVIVALASMSLFNLVFVVSVYKSRRRREAVLGGGGAEADAAAKEEAGRRQRDAAARRRRRRQRGGGGSSSEGSEDSEEEEEEGKWQHDGDGDGEIVGASASARDNAFKTE